VARGGAPVGSDAAVSPSVSKSAAEFPSLSIFASAVPSPSITVASQVSILCDVVVSPPLASSRVAEGPRRSATDKGGLFPLTFRWRKAMPKISGGCLCGAVRYECNAEPLGTAICHCTHCQKVWGRSSTGWIAPALPGALTRSPRRRGRAASAAFRGRGLWRSSS
jgi:hypothetical protein